MLARLTSSATCVGVADVPLRQLCPAPTRTLGVDVVVEYPVEGRIETLEGRGDHGPKDPTPVHRQGSAPAFRGQKDPATATPACSGSVNLPAGEWWPGAR